MDSEKAAADKPNYLSQLQDAQVETKGLISKLRGRLESVSDNQPSLAEESVPPYTHVAQALEDQNQINSQLRTIINLLVI